MHTKTSKLSICIFCLAAFVVVGIGWTEMVPRAVSPQDWDSAVGGAVSCCDGYNWVDCPDAPGRDCLYRYEVCNPNINATRTCSVNGGTLGCTDPNCNSRYNDLCE